MRFATQRCALALVVLTGSLLLSGCGNSTETNSVQAAATKPLHTLTAPNYDPARERKATDDGLSAFELAMQAYGKKEYAKASVLLRDATMKSPGAPEARFFLGICYLMTNDTDAAISELKTAAALGKSAYLEDAHYYLGEAFARKKDAINASRELDSVIAMNGSRAGEARTLREIVNVEAR